MLGIAVRALAIVLAILLAILALLVWTTELDRDAFVRPEDAIIVEDRHGAPLRYHRPEGFDRRWVELADVSPHLIDATLAVEDRRFYEHHGIDARASLRALVTWFWPGRRVSGASTITQQLVKRVYGRPHGLLDKPREMVRATMLERRFGKRWILEQYLNRLPYGDPIVGVARASEMYFGKDVSELTVAQAALLAGIPQAPSALDPRRHLPAAMRRQRFVLSRMREEGRIDETEYRRALRESITIRTQAVRPWRAPRAADAALVAWREGRLGRHGNALRTSLDLGLCEDSERIVRRAIDEHAARGVTNGAAIVVANDTGEILAYVGAARRGDAPAAWMDLVRARRQPGSTLKPFVYELFFERGGTTASLLDDIAPRTWTGRDGVLFAARDYDGRERGPVRAREALSASLNLAALDAARRVGPTRIVRRLRELGFERIGDPDRYGAAIVLGGADVSAYELAGAYVALARDGTRVPLSFTPDIASTPVRMMDPGAARLARDVLSDARARREAFGDDLRTLFPNEPFALKTGTSSGWRDAWSAAFTDEVTVVVWLGDPQGRPLGGLSGFAGAAPAAVRILAAAHASRIALRHDEPREPPRMAQARICALTGLLAGARCAHTIDERFLPGSMPTQRCDAHRDDGAVVLASRYERWLDSTHPAGFALERTTSDEGPRIEHPRDGARLLIDPHRSAIPLRASSPRAHWEVDGRPLPDASWRPSAGAHTLVALLGARRSQPVTVSVDIPE